jgi:histidine phosphotransfer protein HptB
LLHFAVVIIKFDSINPCQLGVQGHSFNRTNKRGFMSEEIIDLNDVLERVQDDKELLSELFDIYQEDFVIKRKILGDAIAAKDITKIKEVAHSMKGASGNISAKSLHAACLKLESLAKVGKTDGMLEVVSEIDGYFEEIKIYAARFKKDLGRD